MATLPMHDGGAACDLDDRAAAQRDREFADVVQRGLRRRSRAPDGTVHLVFDDRAGLESDIRALVGRESECCGFFSFHVDVRDDEIVLQVEAPGDRTEYLDALYRATDPDHATSSQHGTQR